MPRRIRRLILLGLLSLAVIIVVPGPYSDDGVWHKVTEWASDVRMKWDFRERRMRISCGWRTIVLCQQLPARSGPLAQVADSALRSVDELKCWYWPSNRSAGLPLPGKERPFLSCQSTAGDTVVGLIADLDGFVGVVDKGWDSTDPKLSYDKEVQRMEALHGTGHLCPQSDDLTVTDNVRWQLGEINSGIYLAGGRRVHVDYAYGQIYCHTV